jgi:hypothetical protein
MAKDHGDIVRQAMKACELDPAKSEDYDEFAKIVKQVKPKKKGGRPRGVRQKWNDENRNLFEVIVEGTKAGLQQQWAQDPVKFQAVFGKPYSERLVAEITDTVLKTKFPREFESTLQKYRQRGTPGSGKRKSPAPPHKVIARFVRSKGGESGN